MRHSGAMRKTIAPAIALAALASGCSDETMGGLPLLGEAQSAVSVGEIANSYSCNSDGVAPLDLQIIAQANCQVPGAYVALPSFGNVSIGSGVHAFLEQPALDAFAAAVNANPGMNMQVNSMLRTVAEQYILSQWVGSCGITAAASPGQSNHESGLAIDIQQYDAWRNPLEAQGFDWLGSGDPWHFDYAGPGAVDHRGQDVLAFQILWNHNHPEDLIDADGAYGPQTAARLAQAPAEGFPSVPSCGGPEAPDVWLASEVGGASDVFADGASQGTVDLFEDESAEWLVKIENQGIAAATSVTIHIDGGTALLPEAYEIERALADGEPTTDGSGDFADGRAEVTVTDLQPGETATVRIEARVGEYSVESTEPVHARVFVSEVADHYTAADFGAAPENDGTQTFGEGKLELEMRADIYSRVFWELNSDRREGITGAGELGAPSDGALEIPAAAGAFVITPATDVQGDAETTMLLRARRQGGNGDAALYVFENAELLPSDADAEPLRVVIDLPADGEMHEVVIGVAEAPALAGTIARVAFVPFADGEGEAAIDFLRITGTVPGPDDDLTPEDDTGPGDVDGSCSCRAAPTQASTPTLAVLGLLVAGCAARRRPRRRGASTPG